MNCDDCEALFMARMFIESYRLDIENSEEIIGINLVEKGFCQGEIYKRALIMIDRAMKRKTEKIEGVIK